MATDLRNLCDLPHSVVGPEEASLQLTLILGLVALIIAVAALVVVLEDRRAAKRAALRRKARLARLGEVDPLAPGRLRVDR